MRFLTLIISATLLVAATPQAFCNTRRALEAKRGSALRSRCQQHGEDAGQSEDEQLQMQSNGARARAPTDPKDRIDFNQDVVDGRTERAASKNAALVELAEKKWADAQKEAEKLAVLKAKAAKSWEAELVSTQASVERSKATKQAAARERRRAAKARQLEML